MKTMAFGMLAFLLLLCSVCCLHYRRPRLGLVCSAVTVMLTGLTGYSWREMLLGSGKDTALLGFHRYPAAVILLAGLLLAAVAVTAVSILRSVGRKRNP
jgi:hypothetical protein